MAEFDFSLSRDIPLLQACIDADDALAAHVGAVVQRAVIEARESADALGRDRFLLGQQAFESQVSPSARDANRLHVVVGKTYAQWEKDDFNQVVVQIGGGGRYATAAIEMDLRLESVADAVAEAVQRHLQEGYRRVEAHVVGELLSVEHRVATALYIELRSVVDESEASRVGLYALKRDGRAMYLLDPLAIQAVVSYAKSARPSVGASPLTLASMLVTGWVKADETVGKSALANDNTLDVCLQDLRYTTLPGFDVAESTIYGSTAVVQPLVREGSVGLLAGYPARMRDVIEPRLERLKPRFAEILADHARLTKQMVGAEGGEQAWSANRFAELLGRFTGGFTDSMT